MRWIYQKPELARMIGQALFSVGGFIIICGLIGRAGLTALNQARTMGKMPVFAGLSEAYPMYPLWWVPEHLIGYAVPVGVACFGLYVAITAKSVLRGTRRGRR